MFESIVGLMALGLYGWYKLDTNRNRNVDLRTLFDVKKIAKLLYDREEKSRDMVNAIVQYQLGKKSQGISYLQDVFAQLYGLYGISSAGFFVFEKNLSQKLFGLHVQSLCMSPTMQYFCTGTDQGAFIYFKNEFVEDWETGITHCASVTIEEEQSSIIGIGYQGDGKVITVVYANGVVRSLDASQDMKVFLVSRLELKMTCIDSYICSDYPIFSVITDQFEQQIWKDSDDNTVENLFTASFVDLVANHKKTYLDSAIAFNLLKKTFSVYLVINNVIEHKVEIYVYAKKGYVLVFDIAYDGDVICSDFLMEKNLFAFYVKGGAQEGLHIWNLSLKKPGAYFSLKERQGQHPIKITLVNDKVFCLYENGIMDMWHCDADRVAKARDILEKIMSGLSYSLKLEFLDSFAEYLHDRTPSNYENMFEIACSGNNEKEAVTGLFFLQLLPADMLEKMHDAAKNA